MKNITRASRGSATHLHVKAGNIIKGNDPMDEAIDNAPSIAEDSTLISKAVAPGSDEPLLGNSPLFQVDGCAERSISLLKANKAEFVNTKPGDFPSLEDESEGEDRVACAEPRTQKSSGFIPVGRQVAACPYFLRRNTEYTYMLFYLYVHAEFKDTEHLSFKYNKPIKIKRGQYYTAFRYLADAWRVSTSKVKTFLKKMEDAGQIKTQHEPSGTIITLLYYDGCVPATKSKGTQN